MENNGNQSTSFFTINSEEELSVALFSLHSYKGLMEKKDMPVNRLKGEVQEALLSLMDRTLPKEDEKEQTDKPNIDEYSDFKFVLIDEIVMDRIETFCLMHSIIQSYYYIKYHVDLPAEKKAKFEPDFLNHMNLLFAETKDNASDLLWRLTVAISYADYGLLCLEEVFDKKLAVRPLQVDKTNLITVLAINELNKSLFGWTFSQLNYLEYRQDVYVFAKRMYSCQFFHIDDYKHIRDKLKDCKEGDDIEFSIYDVLCLCYSISLCGLLFASDAAEFLDEMERKRGEDDISYYKVRNFLLNVGANFIKEVKKRFMKNDEFNKYIVAVESWRL